MDARGWWPVGAALGLALSVVAQVATAANAPSGGFTSIDQRLPNPDRPYEMTSGTVVFDAPPFFGLYDLEFEPRNPAQLDVPQRTENNTIEFDSVFDISYRAMVSFGLEPVHPVSGIGKAHAVGTASAGSIFEPQVFETELLQLDLYGLSPIPEVYFRESPTLASKGVTIREDLCPPCLAPVTYWRIASYFDVFGEFSHDGGHTWTPGRESFRVEQAPVPGLPGDYNADSTVDAADYVVWRDGLGSTFTHLDYLVWRGNFGRTVGGGTATTFAAVPEPAAYLILASGLVSLAARRRTVPR